MPSEIATTTMNNAAAPAHTDTSPAAVANRARQAGTPAQREDQPPSQMWAAQIPGAG
jgi:hypothetical protein